MSAAASQEIEQLKAEIAVKAEALRPLQSELAILRAKLKRLTMEGLGVPKGQKVSSVDGKQTWVVTKVRTIGDGEFRVHVYGRRVLKSGELASRPAYIGILGFSCVTCKEAVVEATETPQIETQA